MSTLAPTLASLPDGHLSAVDARRGVTLTGRALGLALIVAAVAWYGDPRRFAFAYLVGFAVVMTTGVGALAMLLLQHLTRAGWSAAARRQLEWTASVLWLGPLLFLPLAYLGPHIYEWMRPEALLDPAIMKKASYLSRTGFNLRGFGFVTAWALVAFLFIRLSRRQDTSARPAQETAAMQRYAAPALLIVGLTVTFAGFDWLMSLDPRWYSTIYGVYVIAGALVSALALLALLTLGLERRHVYGAVSTVEHRHDIAKLLFGFTCFWAYIAFCQFFLIWYAGIPEETIFFLRRWEGSWRYASLALAIGHFALPFVVLISRTGKRSRPVLFGAALWLLAMHTLDIFWLVQPTATPEGVHFGLVDLAGLAVPIAALAFVIGSKAAREPAYPVRDPRLAEAIVLENL